MTVETDPKVILPQMANMLGIGPIPKPKWMPKFWHRHLKRQQTEKAISGWVPCPPMHCEPTKKQVSMMIAQELRDWAECFIGYAHIDPEKSAIPRTKHKARFVQHFKYDPPRIKKLSKRGERRLLRKTMRETQKKLEAMGITT